MSGNSILNNAKYSSKNTDEWYTTYETIAEEMQHYQEQFRGKIVLCNCDDPFESNFCYYFLKNFNILQLKKLICTSYSGVKIDLLKDNIQMSLDMYYDNGELARAGQGYVLTVKTANSIVIEKLTLPTLKTYIESNKKIPYYLLNSLKKIRLELLENGFYDWEDFFKVEHIYIDGTNYPYIKLCKL